MKNNYYIYVYFDPTRDLEAFYVGKGKGKRSHCHLTRTDRHPFTHRLQKMAKEGVIPLIERYEDLSEEAAFDLEIALIAEIGRRDLGTGTLLNLTDGGEGGSNPSIETRAKLSLRFKGKPLSAEHKAKISEGTKAAMTEEVCKLVSERTKAAMTPEVRRKVSERTKAAYTGEVRDRARSFTAAQVECPHCHEVGSQLAMKRWHFDNCKKSSQLPINISMTN